MGNLKSQSDIRQHQQDGSFVMRYLENLLVDAYNLLPMYKAADLSKDIETLKKRLDNEGLSFATLVLPGLISGALEALEERHIAFPQFKLQRGSNYPVFLRGIFDAISQDTDMATRATGLKCLYSFSVAFKKLKGPYKPDKLAKQFDEFVEVDRLLEHINLFEPSSFEILEEARRLATRDFQDLTIDSEYFLPRPGPGATATPLNKNLRYEPKVLYRRHDNVLNYQEWFYITPWHAVMSARHLLNLHKHSVSEPHARFIFVPKTVGKARGICAEENETQVLQQAVAAAIRRKIDTCYLKQHIRIQDQTVNAKAALKGSFDRRTCTMDMSEASDRISRDLVAWIFQDVPLYEPLMALSTRWIIPPRESSSSDPLFVHKYAPMGSGLCFPVMSLIHFYLISAIAKVHKKRRRDLMDDVLVYGDDLVVPADLYEPIMADLPKFGMKLNLTKSFHRSHFRESCGIHAYNGVDITPVYVRRTPRTNNAETLVSLLATEELLFNGGFSSAAKFVRENLLHVWKKIPYVHPDSPLIGFRRRWDCGLLMRLFRCNMPRRRYNADLQCHEYRVDTFGKHSDSLALPNDDHACLRWHWMKPEKPRIVGDSTGDLTIFRRWVPESAVTGVTLPVQ